MISFFKKLLSGFLLIIFGPFLLVFFAVFIIYSLLTYLVLLLRGIFRFFRGETFFPETDLDAYAATAHNEEMEADKQVQQVAPINATNLAGATINIYNAGANPLDMNSIVSNNELEKPIVIDQAPAKFIETDQQDVVTTPVLSRDQNDEHNH